MIKYAALIIEKNVGESCFVDVDDSTYISAFGDIFNNAETSHWQKWNGSLKWENMSKCGAFIGTWMKTATPEVLDAENKEPEIFRIVVA